MRRPETWSLPRYMPTLMDRLQDNEPWKSVEAPDTYGPDAHRMHQIVQHDVAILLNTTNLSGSVDAASYAGVSESVVNFGIAPLSGAYSDDMGRAVLERMVRDAVIRFEPRLIADTVAVRPIGAREAPQTNLVGFGISALMHWSPQPIDFHMHCTFDLETGKVETRSSTSAR